MLTIYHNPGCSKSSCVAELLKESGKEFKIINYLTDCPSAEEIKDILKKLAMKPFELVRKNEPIYLENYLGKNLPDDEWIIAMQEHPILIERPIIVMDDKAIIARPPEKVFGFIARL